MTSFRCNANDEIVGRIDAGQLHPMSHPVTRALIEHIPDYSEEDRMLIEAFDANLLDARDWIARQLSLRINTLPVTKQGRLSLLSQLLRPNETVDWELAEYMIAWARGEGVSEIQICSAFGLDL
jgi:hypothetical protein